MNKPAAKEPSMDEILSSIRQIIADDDADAAPVPSAEQVEEDIAFDIPEAFEPAGAGDDDPEALELSADQIVGDDEDGGEEVSLEEGFVAPDLSEIVGEGDSDDEADEDESLTALDPVVPDDLSFDAEQPGEEAEPSPTASMPDPDLSADMAEQLLEPATDAAVRNTFARLGNLPLGNNDVTLEHMVRDMLRPMLKEWLDENLPSVVEKMVEREIERLSRG